MSRNFLKDAEELLSKRDFVQASEKFWGAAATAVKAKAEEQGERHESHKALFEFVSKISKETGEPTIARLFAVASSLHQNFYEGWLPPDLILRYAEDVKALLRALDNL